MNFSQFSPQESIIIFALTVWSIIWKGVATWKSARFDQRNWFIALLVLNTFGFLEIIYLFRFTKKRMTLHEIKQAFKSLFFTNSKS